MGGLGIVAIYKLCQVTGVGTIAVFKAVKEDKKVSPLLAIAIFISSGLTHLFGGSAGREGAALQLGGSIACAFSKPLRLEKENKNILIMCGMAGVFSSVFGTPLCAAVFAIEVIGLKYFCSKAIFSTMISSVISYCIGLQLGITPESFNVLGVPKISIKVLGAVFALAVAVASVSMLFCYSLRFSEKGFEKYIKNPYIRIVTGGIIIVALTLVLKTKDYNGAGVQVIEKIFEEGTVRPEAFLLKIVFTAITIGAGYKGGEIVPAIFIGASSGALISSIFGISGSFGAALGVAALFCGATKCPLATVLLCSELFGGNGLLFYAISAFISFFVSGKSGLYTVAPTFKAKYKT